MTIQEVKERMDCGQEFTLLDVRSSEEYAEGHIKHATLLPLDQIPSLAQQILPDKNQTILVYCHSGFRSRIAVDLLRDMGYSDVENFGGILDWPYEIER